MDNTGLQHTERRQLWARLLIRIALLCIAVVFVIFILPPVLDLVFPFVAALIIAWLFNPLVSFAQRKIRVSRKILSFVFVLLLVLLGSGIIGFFLYTVISEALSLLNDWTGVGYEEGILSSDIFNGLQGILPENINTLIQRFIVQIADWFESSLSAVLSYVTSMAGNFIVWVPSFLIGIVAHVSALYFITSDYNNISSKFQKRLSGDFENFIGLIKRSAKAAFGGYLRAQILLSAIVFFILLLGFIIIGQPYALLLALVFSILDFIPVIGSGTVMIPWAVIDLLFGNPLMALKIMIIWTAIAIFRKVAEPKIIGSQTGLSPMLALISIYIGMKLSGVLGMILGPVLLQILLRIYRSGLFDALISDIKLFINDCAKTLKRQPKKKHDEARHIDED